MIDEARAGADRLATRLDELRLQLYVTAELSPDWFRWLREQDIDIQAAEAHAGVVACCRAVFDEMGFDLDSKGERCVIIEALDERAEEAIDLVGWPIDAPLRFATALGHAEGLGLSQVENPASFFGGQPLMVFKTPLDWLRASCKGVVILRPLAAPRWLGAAIGPIAGQDIDHARAIARLLHGFIPPYRIMAPLPTRRGAA